jgi:hypothetical protein
MNITTVDYTLSVDSTVHLHFSIDSTTFVGNPYHNHYTKDPAVAIVYNQGSNLFYFGARYYDAELGSFTSTDPMDEFWNAYSYCGGDPINLWDPDGMESEDKDNESTELTGSESMELAGSEFFETKEHDNYFLTIYGDPNGPTEAPKANVSHYENKPQTQGDALNKREYSPSYEQIESHRYSPSKILAHYYQDAGPGLSKSTETVAPFILSSSEKRNIEIGINVATTAVPIVKGALITKGAINVVEGTASALQVITKGTPGWDATVKQLASMTKGKINFRVNSASDANALLKEAKGNMNRYKNYTTTKYTKGFEVHNVQNPRELGVGNDLQHLKWSDGKAGGHIFYKNPN